MGAIEAVASVSILLITRPIRVGFVYNKCREIEYIVPESHCVKYMLYMHIFTVILHVLYITEVLLQKHTD